MLFFLSQPTIYRYKSACREGCMILKSLSILLRRRDSKAWHGYPPCSMSTITQDYVVSGIIVRALICGAWCHPRRCTKIIRWWYTKRMRDDWRQSKGRQSLPCKKKTSFAYGSNLGLREVMFRAASAACSNAVAAMFQKLRWQMEIIYFECGRELFCGLLFSHIASCVTNCQPGHELPSD